MHRLQGSKILVVEDDPKMRESIQALLNVHGFDVQARADLPTARSALQDIKYDLVLLDLKLKDQLGFALMDDLVGRQMDTHVIVVTGQDSEKYAITALKKGATDYLKKPFEPDALVESINTVLNRQRRRRELKLLKHAVEASSAAILVGDADGKVVYTNAACRNLAVASDGAGGHPPHPPGKDDHIHHVLETGIPWKGQARLVDSAGKPVVAYKHVDPIPEQIDGRTYGVALMCDMTARLKKEQAVANSRERYRKVVDSQREFLYRLNSDLLLTFVNQTYATFKKKTPRAMIGMPITHFVPKPIQPLLLKTLNAVRSGAAPIEIELMVTDDNKRAHWQQWRFEGIYNAEDQLTELQGVGRDVTRSKRFEKEIEENKEKFRNLAELTSDWLWEVDREGVFSYTNPVVSNLLGFSSEEVIGKSAFAFMPHDEARRTQSIFEHALSAGKPLKNIESTNLRKDGSQITLETSGVPIYNEVGGIIGYRGINRDVSVRKNAEKRLKKESEKLKQALAKVKRLSGMLPICASCKKIRDDSGYWSQIEEYIENNSDAEFSHGICPECARKLYPELYE